MEEHAIILSFPKDDSTDEECLCHWTESSLQEKTDRTYRFTQISLNMNFSKTQAMCINSISHAPINVFVNILITFRSSHTFILLSKDKFCSKKILLYFNKVMDVLIRMLACVWKLHEKEQRILQWKSVKKKPQNSHMCCWNLYNNGLGGTDVLQMDCVWVWG